MAMEQTDYRWENDDGSESASTFLGAVNTSVNIDVALGDVSKRLRVAIFDTGESTMSAGQLEFSVNGGAWTNLTTTSTPVKAFNSTNLTDGNDCTQRINATTFASTNEGVIETGSGGISEFNNSGTEHLYTITFISSAMSFDDSIDFRIAEASTFTNTGNAVIKITPTIAAASVKTINNGGSTTGTASPTLNASGNDRILVMAYVGKDNTATAAAPSAIVVDSAGVNATLANGKVVHQGTLQIAQEGSFSSTCDVFFCLEANLPTSAGAYVVDMTLDSAPQYHMWIIFEVKGCPQQAYDAIKQSLTTVDISANTKFSDSITPVDADCLIIDLWGTSHSSSPTFTSTETLLASISNTFGASVSSQFTQVGGPTAKTMEESSSTSISRRAWTLLSFSGAPSSGGVNYDRTLSDSLDVTDVEQKAMNLSRLMISNVDVTDKLITESLFFRLLSSGIDIQDLIIRSTVGAVINRTLISAIDISDSLLSSKQLLRSLISRVDVSDSQMLEVLLDRVLTSNIDINDFISTVISGGAIINRTLTSSISVSDLVLSYTNLSRLLSSELSVNDSAEKQALFSRLLSSDVIVSDAISRIITSQNLVSRILSDNVSTNDKAEKYTLMERSLTSSLNITDTQYAYKLLKRTLTDVFYLSDSIIRTLVEAGIIVISRNLTDAVTISDSVSRNLLVSRLLSENITLTDSTIRGITGVFVELILSGIEIKNINIEDVAKNINVSDEIKSILISMKDI